MQHAEPYRVGIIAGVLRRVAADTGAPDGIDRTASYHRQAQRGGEEAMQLKPVDQQVVVVMGASSGIGRETALRFARRGARVGVAARG